MTLSSLVELKMFQRNMLLPSLLNRNTGLCSSESSVNSCPNTQGHISEEIISIVTAVIVANFIHKLRLIKQNDYSVDKLGSIPYRGQGFLPLCSDPL